MQAHGRELFVDIGFGVFELTWEKLLCHESVRLKTTYQPKA